MFQAESEHKILTIDPFKVPENHGLTKKIYIKLAIVSAICVVFMVGEVIGGILSSSISLLTDAAHMLSDLVGFGISFLAVWLSRRPATEKLSYGFHRAEVIGGCASILLIWGLTIWLIVEAVNRVNNPEEVDGEIMMITAAGGLLANIVMGKVLHGHGHGHDHSHAHSHKHEHEPKHKHEHKHEHEQENKNKNQGGCGNEKEEGQLKELVEGNARVEQIPANLELNKPHFINSLALEIAPNTNNQEIPFENDHKGHKKHHKCVHRNHQFKLMRLFACTKTCQPKIRSEDKTIYDCCPQEKIPKPLVTQAQDHQSHENYNIKAAMLHVLGDFLQSIAVLVASIAIYFKPEVSILDPILTFIFSILVLMTTLPMMREFIGILMEGNPRGIKVKELKEEILKINELKEMHDFHVWALTSGKFALSAHIFSDEMVKTLRDATLICRKFGIFHSTIQIEQWSLKGSDDFIKCMHNLH